MAKIETHVDGQVGWLTLNAPERRNALSFEMYEAIPAAVDQLLVQDVRCVVLRGAGTEAFGAGSDISEFATQRIDGAEKLFAQTEALAHTAVRSIPVPTIAMIHGHCRGGGLALALCCDMRFADTNATFAIPPAKLGLGYPVEAIGHLVSIVGDPAARLMLLTAATLDAPDALQFSLVQRVLEPDTLAAEVDQITTSISRLAPLTLRAAKMGLNVAQGSGDAQVASKAAADCYASDDYREGITAFMEKRHPVFQGK